MNALKRGFVEINLNADLDAKIRVITSNLQDNVDNIPFFDDGQKVTQLISMVVACCNLSFAFHSTAIVWLESLAATYLTALDANRDLLQKIFKVTEEVLLHSTEENKLLVLEFWTSSSEQEVDYREGASSKENSLLFIGSFAPDLVPLLIQIISDDKYPTQDHEDWNARKAAAICLQFVTKVILDNIEPLVSPMLQQGLNSEDWKKREVAVSVLGLIFTEQHYDYVTENATVFLPQVLDSLRHGNAHVRSAAAWTLNQICRTYANCVEVHYPALTQALLNALNDENRDVQEHTLGCIINFTSSKNPFEQDFAKFVQVLLLSLSQPNDNTDAIYEALAALVNMQENIEPIKSLVPLILRNLQQDLTAISVATAITRKLKEEMAPHADQLMAIYLPYLHTAVTEDVLLAVGYTSIATSEKFAKFLPSLMPLVLPLLNNVPSTDLFQAAVGMLSDLCHSVKSAIQPYCDTIVQSLLMALANPQAEMITKSDVMALLGDIATAIGGAAYERYLPFVQQMFIQAGNFIMQQNMLGSLSQESLEMQQAWFSAWSSLYQSFHHNPAALMDSTTLIIKAAVIAVDNLVHSHEASIPIYLVGDIIQCLGDEVKPQLSQIAQLNQCLTQALQSKDKTVVQAATWVLERLKE